MMSHLLDSVSVIQMSDVHYPDTSERSVDWKDKGFPLTLGTAISVHPLQTVLRELLNVVGAKKDSLAALLFCGDLTSEGDLEGYQRCLEHLDQALQLSQSAVWSKNQIHAVPGNHDVSRRACGSVNLLSKFEPLIMAWDGLGGRKFTDRVRHEQITTNGCSLDVLSLNSCIGCGEVRFMPAKVRGDLHDLITTGPDQDLQWEQLDTPAFFEDDVDAVARKIDELPGHSLAIVLSHHNLLPQALPRIEIYAEAVNAGLARSRFSRCKHPIIYCHGHVHETPIEVVVNARVGRGKLVCVGDRKSVV
jgi:hypothetical protein